MNISIRMLKFLEELILSKWIILDPLILAGGSKHTHIFSTQQCHFGGLTSTTVCLSVYTIVLVSFSHSVMSDSLWPHGL